MSSLCLSNGLANAAIASGFCAWELPVQVDRARMLLTMDTVSDMLVLEAGSNTVSLIQETGEGSFSKRELVSEPGINHGIAVRDNFLYASAPNDVYRWSYQGFFDTVTDRTTVITNMNRDSNGNSPTGHWTRTLIFDPTGNLFVSVGSVGNVDRDSYRSRIRKFPKNRVTNEAIFPISFATGEVFADGVRNEVGLAFDKFDVLWGVENGADNLARPALGNNIYNDNPAEKLNRFPERTAGSHYGYPYCWTEYKLPSSVSKGRGTNWAWPSNFPPENQPYKDSQCRKKAQFVPPELSMQAHSAPLGLVFYKYTPADQRPVECPANVAFPRYMDGYAFVAFHGSWNRQVPTGYKVVYVPMTSNGNVKYAEDDPVDLLAHGGSGARWPDNFRPVDVDFDACGRLLITSDGSGNQGAKIVRMEFTGNEATFCSACSTTRQCCDGKTCVNGSCQRQGTGGGGGCRSKGKKCMKPNACCSGLKCNMMKKCK